MIQLNFSWHIARGPFVLRCEHLASLTTRPLLPTCQTCWRWDLLAWWNSFACGTSKLRLRSLTAGPFIKITGSNFLRFHSNVLPRRTNLRASCHLANVAVQASSRSASKHLNHAGKHWSVPGRHCVFWPSALHGIYGYCFADHIDKLRSRATLALQSRKAGSSPALRLTLSTTPQAEPALWRAMQLMQAFRRVGAKEPRFLMFWQLSTRQSQGDLYSGPFPQFLHVTNELGWHVQPPS